MKPKKKCPICNGEGFHTVYEGIRGEASVQVTCDCTCDECGTSLKSLDILKEKTLFRIPFTSIELIWRYESKELWCPERGTQEYRDSEAMNNELYEFGYQKGFNDCAEEARNEIQQGERT
jgi:hypothetical protein